MTGMTDGLAAITRARRRRLRQEVLVRATIALLVLVFNESYHGASLIRVASLTALALNVPYYLAVRIDWQIRLQAYVRLVLDILLITLGLYGAGGILAAPYLSVYMVAPIYVAFVLSGGACLFAAGLATASFLVAAFLQHTYSSASTAIPVGVWPIAIFNLVLLNVVAGLTALLAAAYRQSRRQLAESEECFRSVAKAATDAILVTDDAGSVVVSNRAAEAMFGYPSTKMLRTPLARSVLIPDRYREPGGHAPQGLRTTGVKPIALTGVKIDGAQFPAELSRCRRVGWSDSSSRPFRWTRPVMIDTRLLKSCAMPPASEPRVSIFWSWRFCRSSSLRSLMSGPNVTGPVTMPSPFRKGAVEGLTSMSVPSFLRRRTSRSK